MQTQNILNRILIYLYRKVEGRTPDDTSGPPLALPPRGVFLTFLASLVIVVLASNLFTYVLYRNIEVAPITYEVRTNDAQEVALIEALGGIWPRNLIAADSSTRSMLQQSFVTETGNYEVSVPTLLTFLRVNSQNERGQNLTDVELRRVIVGSLTHSWLGTPSLESPDFKEYLTEIGLINSYREEDLTEKNKAAWARMVAFAGLQKLRGKLNEDGLSLSSPRRLLIALTGPIQSLTFITATFCLLLLLLRMGWVKLEMQEAYNFYWARPQVQGKGQEAVEDHTPPTLAFWLVARVRQELSETNPSSSQVATIISEYRDRIESGGYSLIDYLCYAIPTLGFLGTVQGMISGLETASAIFEARNSTEEIEALDLVSTALGSAFDTSFVALIATILLTYILKAVTGTEANLLEVILSEEQKRVTP